MLTKIFTFFFFFCKGKRKEERMEMGGGDRESGRKREKEPGLAATCSRGCPQGASPTFRACSCQAGVTIFYLFFPLFKISIDVMF